VRPIGEGAMPEGLVSRYDERIAGVLSCYDRIVVTGTVPGICHAKGMTSFLYANGILIFDYPKFAEKLRDKLRENAAKVAGAAGVSIEHISKSHIRKEDIVAKAIAQRGDRPGLAHVISAMEACGAYKPWHDKKTGKTFLRPDSGKCLHYYFYFIDEELGLIYVRVPTWAPFRLQVYCNGHSWPARKLTAEGIGFTAGDNAFLRIDGWDRAQALADGFSPGMLHRILDRYAALCCPVLDTFKQSYHWSLMQVEYSTDLVFRSKATPAPLYEQLARHSVPTVKAETIATFLGRTLAPNPTQEIGSRFSTRIEGTCIKHRFGKSSIKMYDKLGTILRIETTTNDVSFFKHYRKVEHRNGPSSMGFAPMKKNIYSLADLGGILFACNRRYLAHLSALDDFSAGVKLLDRVTRPRKVEGKTVKGVDFFNPTGRTLLGALKNPKFNIAGVRRADLSPLLQELSPSALSRHIRRLRHLGLIKRVARTYRYYLTCAGRAVIAAATHITEYGIIPALA
jgi:hypothetical protein